jgi:hypothetical protein
VPVAYRHTRCDGRLPSLLFAIGEAPPYVMAQMGHTTPNLTLAIYARQMDRRDGELEHLKALCGSCGQDKPPQHTNSVVDGPAVTG